MSLLNYFSHKGQLRGVHARNEKSSHFQVDGEDQEESGEDKVDANLKEPDVDDNPESEETYEILEREILPAKIICPDCGGITLEGLEYCDKCGGELQ